MIAAWNLVEPGAAGAEKTITFDLNNIATGAHAVIRRVDAAHGDSLDAWKKMGSPAYPTKAQIEALRKASETGAPEMVEIPRGRLSLTVPSMGLAVVEVR